MASNFNRRDFLRLAGFLPLTLATPRWVSGLSSQQNVIVIVFDAFSAFDISAYGYQRDTTPNIRRLAQRAIVYHNHYAGSNFTTSGTASLLTGTLPWTHRALRPKDPVAEPFVRKNFFGVFDDYFRLAYTHNGWANILLEQFESVLNEHVPWKSLFLGSYDNFVESLFQKDEDIASVSWTRNLNLQEDGYAYSLFFSHLYEKLEAGSYSDVKRLFPRGLPSTGDVGSYFILERAIDWIGQRLVHVPQPFFGYFHLLPPHGPYNTELQYYNHFRGDGLKPPDKPADVFTEDVSNETLLRRRTEYDEYILYVDREFGRFYDSLEKAGLLENTWLVLTSDHGEMFERGIVAHSTNALYQPVVRIPLMIFEPGRQAGMDIQSATSAADVLPTLAQVTGHPIPAWTEGTVLPPFASNAPDPNRHVYVVRSTRTLQDQPLATASLMLLKDRYKLLYFFGYPERGIEEMVKLFDVRSDPGEVVDLSVTEKDLTAAMLGELKARLNEVNKPYT